MDDAPLFVVAIDFGTTYSGYAYCSKHDFKEDPPIVFAFENWVAGGQGMSKKTPTCLLLTPEKEFHAFGYEAENEYNALAASNEHKEWYFFKRFKMKLHGEEDIGDDFMIEDEMGKPLPAIDVFSKSISSLKEHFLDQVLIHGIDIKENEIRWILTVPAIWSDSSKRFMRKAAVKAGLKARNLKIALEPEAASIFCQHLKTERSGPGSLCVSGPGTKYMIVDIGGGTADITVHEKLAGGKLREIYKASGGAWGGTAVDQQYLQLLTKIVGGPVMFEFQHNATPDYLDMMREFEVTKRNVNPKSRASVNVRVYASLDQICQKLNGENIGDIASSSNFPYKTQIRKVGDKLLFDKEIMQELFMKVIRQITDHVEIILKDRAVKGVSILILAGGFSESPILQDAFRSKFQTEERRVIVSQEAGLSVLKGAVIFGHRPNEIQARILRYTYGLKARRPFVPEEDPKDKKCGRHGKEYCRDIFSVMIQQGSKLETGHRVFKEFNFDNDRAHERIAVYLSSAQNPRFIDDKDCRLIKKVNIKSKLPKTSAAKYSLGITYIFGDTEVEIEIKDNESGFIYNDTFDYDCD